MKMPERLQEHRFLPADNVEIAVSVMAVPMSTDQEIEHISAYIGVDPQSLCEQYCCLSGDRPVLAQKDDGHCMFWDKLCTIHPVKPRMCREWPYIESILIDFENWKIMASMCPGMNSEASAHIVKAWIKKRTSCGKPEMDSI